VVNKEEFRRFRENPLTTKFFEEVLAPSREEYVKLALEPVPLRADLTADSVALRATTAKTAVGVFDEILAIKEEDFPDDDTE
jgi:hypothetical protein